ncbi:acyl-CoA thioesterase [Acinetobacter indicus]|uniref:Thioesterase family protein n=1 Tax=Acinetobacter indicus TaxID=756892 RepID=A0AAW8Z399_9GAMM|nr:thioesterase family protein [Acinetobacter indicus]MDM1291009.1 acyl-CoA thioesterase [Acinetobacter indicus]MDM1321177.1 acyl-CoA thioesterase [Acinetobacter indicus]MDM1332865.1 acyl-CoA thioesterase [Acinetobacter indicus]MDV4314540.1 thioesterase family protein [Acinetobacter indicus]QIZ58867.1 acyl-CoA thioesterase [Acinetobacter indicus]
MQLTDYPVIHQQVVAWGDMDALGHVNNVMYYRYIESARIHYMDQIRMMQQSFSTVVASNQCKYMRPVFYPDTLKIGVRVEEIRNSAFRMHYILWSEQQQAVVASAEAIMVCVNSESMQKMPLPESIRQRILTLENSVGHYLD